jgi:hypothetical protein
MGSVFVHPLAVVSEVAFMNLRHNLFNVGIPVDLPDVVVYEESQSIFEPVWEKFVWLSFSESADSGELRNEENVCEIVSC